MRLTLYTDYSLRVLLYLAHKAPEQATITEIAEYFEIARNHLVKVVHQLGVHGYVHTVRGRHGGLSLAKSPAHIVVGDVVRITEPDMDLLECFNKDTDRCVISRTCQLKGVLFKARQAFMDELDACTLSDLSPPPKAGKVSGIQLFTKRSQ